MKKGVKAPESPWTPERAAALPRLREAGFSASQIAAQLGGGITRNAVIGRMNRTGLAKRKEAKPMKPEMLTTIAVTSRVRSVAIPVVVQLADSDIGLPEVVIDDLPMSDALGISFAELDNPSNPRLCRWPVGNPGKNMRYCGEATAIRSHAMSGDPVRHSWCPAHCKLVYAPSSSLSLKEAAE
jgi:GcrA cell cycle regulator